MKGCDDDLLAASDQRDALLSLVPFLVLSLSVASSAQAQSSEGTTVISVRDTSTRLPVSSLNSSKEIPASTAGLRKRDKELEG
jgi:hypothetical protein